MTRTAKILLNEVRVTLNAYTLARMKGDENADRLKQKMLKAQSALKDFVSEVFSNYYNPWKGTMSKTEILAKNVNWTPRHVMIFNAIEKAIEEETKNEKSQVRSNKPAPKPRKLSSNDPLHHFLSKADMENEDDDEDWEFAGAEDLAEKVWERVMRMEAGEYKAKKE